MKILITVVIATIRVIVGDDVDVHTEDQITQVNVISAVMGIQSRHPHNHQKTKRLQATLFLAYTPKWDKPALTPFSKQEGRTKKRAETQAMLS